MRKFVFILMSGLLALSLYACKKGEEAASPPPEPVEAVMAPEPAPPPPPMPPAEEAPEPTPPPAEEGTPPVD